MDDKKLKKKIEKIVRNGSSENLFGKIDKILKIRKIKAEKVVFKEYRDNSVVYRVTYKYGVNKLNPLAWVYVIIAIIPAVIELIKEIIEELKDGQYTEDIIIKNTKEE